MKNCGNVSYFLFPNLSTTTNNTATPWRHLNLCHRTITTSLAFKREPEVIFFGRSNVTPTTTTSLAFNREPQVFFFRSFRHIRHHHLPHVQTRVEGYLFWHFDATATTITFLAFKHELEEYLWDHF
jgi:hypothetical protein